MANRISHGRTAEVHPIPPATAPGEVPPPTCLTDWAARSPDFDLQATAAIGFEPWSLSEEEFATLAEDMAAHAITARWAWAMLCQNKAEIVEGMKCAIRQGQGDTLSSSFRALAQYRKIVVAHRQIVDGALGRLEVALAVIGTDPEFEGFDPGPLCAMDTKPATSPVEEAAA